MHPVSTRPPAPPTALPPSPLAACGRLGGLGACVATSPTPCPFISSLQARNYAGGGGGQGPSRTHSQIWCGERGGWGGHAPTFKTHSSSVVEKLELSRPPPSLRCCQPARPAALLSSCAATSRQQQQPCWPPTNSGAMNPNLGSAGPAEASPSRHTKAVATVASTCTHSHTHTPTSGQQGGHSV